MPSAASTSSSSPAWTRVLGAGSIQRDFGHEIVTNARGDVVVFRGDQRHGYHNPGEGVAVAYSLVLPGAMRA